MLGLGLFMCFFIGFIVRGLRNLNRIGDEVMRATAAGFVLSGIGIMPMSLVSPVYMQWFSIVCVGVISGMTEIIIYLNSSTERGLTLKET